MELNWISVRSFLILLFLHFAYCISPGPPVNADVGICHTPVLFNGSPSAGTRAWGSFPENKVLILLSIFSLYSVAYRYKYWFSLCVKYSSNLKYCNYICLHFISICQTAVQRFTHYRWESRTDTAEDWECTQTLFFLASFWQQNRSVVIHLKFLWLLWLPFSIFIQFDWLWK